MAFRASASRLRRSASYAAVSNPTSFFRAECVILLLWDSSLIEKWRFSGSEKGRNRLEIRACLGMNGSEEEIWSTYVPID